MTPDDSMRKPASNMTTTTMNMSSNTTIANTIMNTTIMKTNTISSAVMSKSTSELAPASTLSRWERAGVRVRSMKGLGFDV